LTPIIAGRMEVHPQEPYKVGMNKDKEQIEIHVAGEVCTSITRVFGSEIDDLITALVTYRERHRGVMENPIHLQASSTGLMERVIRQRFGEAKRELENLGYTVDPYKKDIHGNSFFVWPVRVTRPGGRSNESIVVRDCADVETLEGVLEHVRPFGHVSHGELDRMESGRLYRDYELERARDRAAKFPGE
jgi:hypothetical protein